MNEAHHMILDNLGYNHDRLALEDILDKMSNKAVAIESSDEINWPGTTEETRFLFKDGSSVITYLEDGCYGWHYGKQIDPPRPEHSARKTNNKNETRTDEKGEQMSWVDTLSQKLDLAGIENRIWEGHSRIRIYLTPPRDWLEINGQSRVGWRGIRAFFDYSPEEIVRAREPYDGSTDVRACSISR